MPTGAADRCGHLASAQHIAFLMSCVAGVLIDNTQHVLRISNRVTLVRTARLVSCMLHLHSRPACRLSADRLCSRCTCLNTTYCSLRPLRPCSRSAGSMRPAPASRKPSPAQPPRRRHSTQPTVERAATSAGAPPAQSSADALCAIGVRDCCSMQTVAIAAGCLLAACGGVT